jgi:hypothetical protein
VSAFRFSSISQILAIKIFKKHIVLALKFFSIAFWLYIYIASKKMAAKICYIPWNGPQGAHVPPRRYTPKSGGPETISSSGRRF